MRFLWVDYLGGVDHPGGTDTPYLYGVLIKRGGAGPGVLPPLPVGGIKGAKKTPKKGYKKRYICDFPPIWDFWSKSAPFFM